MLGGNGMRVVVKLLDGVVEVKGNDCQVTPVKVNGGRVIASKYYDTEPAINIDMARKMEESKRLEQMKRLVEERERLEEENRRLE